MTNCKIQNLYCKAIVVCRLIARCTQSLILLQSRCNPMINKNQIVSTDPEMSRRPVNVQKMCPVMSRICPDVQGNVQKCVQGHPKMSRCPWTCPENVSKDVVECPGVGGHVQKKCPGMASMSTNIRNLSHYIPGHHAIPGRNSGQFWISLDKTVWTVYGLPRIF